MALIFEQSLDLARAAPAHSVKRSGSTAIPLEEFCCHLFDPLAGRMPFDPLHQSQELLKNFPSALFPTMLSYWSPWAYQASHLSSSGQVSGPSDLPATVLLVAATRQPWDPVVVDSILFA